MDSCVAGMFSNLFQPPIIIVDGYDLIERPALQW